MKKYFVVVLLSLLPSLAHADDGKKLHEVALSYGGGASEAFSYADHFITDFDKNSLGHYLGNADFLYNLKNIGVFSFSYHYYPLNWMAVGVKTAVTADYGTIMDANTYEESRYSCIMQVYDFYFDLKFVYLDRPWVRLYSNVALGGGVVVDDSRRYLTGESLVSGRLLFQTVPFGVSVGKRLSGFVQLEAGTSMIGASAGISYRF